MNTIKKFFIYIFLSTTACSLGLHAMESTPMAQAKDATRSTPYAEYCTMRQRLLEVLLQESDERRKAEVEEALVARLKQDRDELLLGMRPDTETVLQRRRDAHRLAMKAARESFEHRQESIMQKDAQAKEAAKHCTPDDLRKKLENLSIALTSKDMEEESIYATQTKIARREQSRFLQELTQ